MGEDKLVRIVTREHVQRWQWEASLIEAHTRELEAQRKYLQEKIDAWGAGEDQTPNRATEGG